MDNSIFGVFYYFIYSDFKVSGYSVFPKTAWTKLITPLMLFAFFSLIFIIVGNPYFRGQTYFHQYHLLLRLIAICKIVISMLNFLTLKLKKRSLKVIAFGSKTERTKNFYLIWSMKLLRNSKKNERIGFFSV